MIGHIDKQYISISVTKSIKRLISYLFFEGRPVTTKGQWINPIILFLFSLEKRLPQLKKIKKPVFIVGTGRSGTTILGILLSLHRDVGFLNEPKALWHSVYAAEDIIGSYSRGTASYRLGEEEARPDVIRAAHRLYGAYLIAVCCKRVVDKYPEFIFRVPFIKKIFPDAKFLFLVRNGWDTCFSIKRWSEQLGVINRHEIHNWWGVDNRKWKLLIEQIVANDILFKDVTDTIATYTDHVDMAMVEWIVTMREGMEQMRKNPDSFMMVRFEELTHSPITILSDILEFCELPEDTKLFQYAEQVVSPIKPHPSLKIHPAIHHMLSQISKELGY